MGQRHYNVVSQMDSESEVEADNKNQIKQNSAQSDIVVYPSVYRCPLVVFLLMFACIVCGALAWSYYYMAYPLAVSLASTRDAINAINTLTVTELAELAQDSGRIFRLNQMPNNTLRVLLAHDPTSNGVTAEEEHILLSAWNIYDTNGDNMWSLPEFELFIEDTVQPSRRFDAMDLDKNGVLSLKEIYLTMKAFDETDIFACSDSDKVLFDVFGYDTSPRDNLYYEYLAHLWMYELDQLGIDIISKANYVKYIQDEEAFYHGYNESSVVGFEPFKNGFFDSVYFQSWSNYRQLDFGLIADAYDELSAINDADIASLQLTTQQSDVNPTIESYMDGRTYSVSTGHSPTRSLLYAFPINDAATRRRMEDMVKMADYEESCEALEIAHFTQIIHWDTLSTRTTETRTFSRMCHVDLGGSLADNTQTCECVCNDCRIEDLSDWNSDLGRYTSCAGSPMIVPSHQTDVTSATSMPRESCGCFGEDNVVMILADGIEQEMQLKDVSAGDYVFDGTEYSKVIAVARRDEQIKMMKIRLNDKSQITMTENHLLYNEQFELMTAINLKVGDKLLNDLVVLAVEYGLYEAPLNALTMSGKIQVNGVTASCYVFSPDFATSIHHFLSPFRFLSENVSEYYTAKVIESIVLNTACEMKLGAQIGPNFGLPPFMNAVIIMLSFPMLFVKQLTIFCFSEFSVSELGHLMTRYLS